MSAQRMVFAAVATGALTWALAASSGVSVPWHAADATELRLSWSARPERIETCRTLSDEEFAARPAHMRRRVECEGRAATYALLVAIDGDTIERAMVSGGGLRHDRLLYLLRAYPQREGPRGLLVRFTRQERVDSSRTPNAIAPDLVLDTVVDFRRGHAVLVTYASGVLVVRDP